MLFVL